MEQYYPEIEEEFSLPIAYYVEYILTGLGFQVVGEGASCDATLTITLTGKALGRSYAVIGKTGSYEYCYTGAQVNGQMTLTLRGRAPLALPIIGRKDPDPFLTFSCPGKNGAPFRSVWQDALLDGLAQLWPPQVFILALGDEDKYVRQVAAGALGAMGPEAVEAVPALIQALGDEDIFVRDGAAGALGAIGPEAKEAVPALIEALRNADVPRSSAAWALGAIGPEAWDAVPVLIEALGDEDIYVRMRAAEALKKITGKDFSEDADAWQEWWEEQK